MRSRTRHENAPIVRIHEGNYFWFGGAKLKFSEENFFVEDGEWEEGYNTLRVNL